MGSKLIIIISSQMAHCWERDNWQLVAATWRYLRHADFSSGKSERKKTSNIVQQTPNEAVILMRVNDGDKASLRFSRSSSGSSFCWLQLLLQLKRKLSSKLIYLFFFCLAAQRKQDICDGALFGMHSFAAVQAKLEQSFSECFCTAQPFFFCC